KERKGKNPFPSSPRRGVRDINNLSRSDFSGADGVVTRQNSLWPHTTPSALRADTPPRRGGGKSQAPCSHVLSSPQGTASSCKLTIYHVQLTAHNNQWTLDNRKKLF